MLDLCDVFSPGKNIECNVNSVYVDVYLESTYMYTYIYIYLFVYMCVRACVCIVQIPLGNQHQQKSTIKYIT